MDSSWTVKPPLSLICLIFSGQFISPFYLSVDRYSSYDNIILQYYHLVKKKNQIAFRTSRFSKIQLYARFLEGKRRVRASNFILLRNPFYSPQIRLYTFPSTSHNRRHPQALYAKVLPQSNYIINWRKNQVHIFTIWIVILLDKLIKLCYNISVKFP